MVRAAEAHHFVAPGVVARQPHSLHDCLSARHVERQLVHTRDALQPLHVVQHHRVIGTQHRAKCPCCVACLVNAVFVDIVTQQVNAVGAGQVIEDIAIQISDRNTGRGLQEGAHLEPLLSQVAELKRNAIRADKLQVRQTLHHRGAGRQCDGKSLRNGVHHILKSRLPLGHHAGRCPVQREHLLAVIAVVGQQRSQAPRDARVPRQAPMFGLRQGQAAPRFASQYQQCGAACAPPHRAIQAYQFVHVSTPFIPAILENTLP